MFLFAVITMIAVSCAWGIRGDLIGGEEGAMLPGAFLGFFVAFFIGGEFFSTSALLMTALGVVGMFIGGTEPYGETFNLINWKEGGIKTAVNPKKGAVGLCLKGAPWFGICAATLSVGLSAASGVVYQPHQLIILVALLPVVRCIGVRLFNDPHDPDNGVLPKHYFSENSREEWGGTCFMLALFIIFEAVCNDFSSLIITLFGAFGGAVGWVIAKFFSCFTCVRMKNGKYPFGKYQEQHRIDNWKIMEFAYGALGALSVAVGFIVCREKVLTLASYVNLDTGFCGIPNGVQIALFIIWIALLILDVLRHFIPAKFDRINKSLEIMHRPVLCYVPMLLLFLGNTDVAKFMSITVLFWMAVEELCFVQLKKRYDIGAASVISCILLAIVTIYTMLVPYDGVNLKVYYFFMCLVYFACTVMADISAVYGLEGKPKKLKDLILSMGSFISVKLHYVFCIIFTMIFLIVC